LRQGRHSVVPCTTKYMHPGPSHTRVASANWIRAFCALPANGTISPFKFFFIPRCAFRPWASHKQFPQ
jgi:hypothetical protein